MLYRVLEYREVALPIKWLVFNAPDMLCYGRALDGKLMARMRLEAATAMSNNYKIEILIYQLYPDYVCMNICTANCKIRASVPNVLSQSLFSTCFYQFQKLKLFFRNSNRFNRVFVIYAKR